MSREITIHAIFGPPFQVQMNSHWSPILLQKSKIRLKQNCKSHIK